MEYDVAFVGKVRMTVGCLILAPTAWRWATFYVMLCGRGLRTTHIHRPLTTYVPGAKIVQIFETPKSFAIILRTHHYFIVLSNFEFCYLQVFGDIKL